MARLKLVVAALAVLLAAALVAIAILHPMASRTLVDESHRPFVERAQREAALQRSLSPAQIVRETYPLAIRAADLICVELRWRRSDDALHIACYDAGSGELIEERVVGPAS